MPELIRLNALVWFAIMRIHISYRIFNRNFLTICICKFHEKISGFITEFITLNSLFSVFFNIKPAISADCKICTRRMRNQQIPFTGDFMRLAVTGNKTAPAIDVFQCIIFYMPLRVTAGAVLYITAVSLVTQFTECRAYPLRFLASY